MPTAFAVDLQSLKDLLIPAHGVVGVLAIGAGCAALAVAKRPGWHPRAGRSFLVLMALSMALAAPVIAVSGNTFLTAVGLLVAYHGIVAWRLAWLQPPRRLPQTLDRVVQPVFGLVFVVFAAYGLNALVVHGHPMGLVAVVLASLSLTAVWHFHRYFGQTEFRPGGWVGEHIRGAATAFIASLTAFGAAAGPRLAPDVPEVLLWLGPTMAFAPLFVWVGRGYRPPE